MQPSLGLKNGVPKAIYTIIFVCLLLFSILSGFYLDEAPTGLASASFDYSNKYATINPITCGLPISGQYGRAPQITYYVLLAITVILRNNERLAAGAAVSAMTYSGTTAIHNLIFFAQNNRLHEPAANAKCTYIDLTSGAKALPLCAGVYDPDYYHSTNIISAGLLAALPIAMWSKTFQKATDRPVLVTWMLLLAISHIFYNITATDPSPHFQICSKDSVIEPLPGSTYNAVAFDHQWQQAFNTIVFNDSSGAASANCIYSCFSPVHHLGRRDQEIGIYNASVVTNMYTPTDRKIGVPFWLIYTSLATLTLFTMKGKSPSRPLPMSKRERHGLSWWQLFRCFTYENKVDGLTCLRWITQMIAVVAFIGFVPFSQMEYAENGPYSEPFSAVGQWSSLAAVVLVVAAAGVIKITEIFRWESDPRGRLSCESGKDEWDCRCGYG